MTVNDYLRAIAGFLHPVLSVALGYWVHPGFLSLYGLRRSQPLAVGLHEEMPDDLRYFARWASPIEEPRASGLDWPSKTGDGTLNGIGEHLP